MVMIRDIVCRHSSHNRDNCSNRVRGSKEVKIVMIKMIVLIEQVNVLIEIQIM